MNPAETIRSGSCAATASANATSHASRSAKSLTRRTKVGTPAASALSRAGMSGAVRAHGDDVRAVRRIGGRVEQRLEVGARPGNEDDQPNGHGRGAYRSSGGGSAVGAPESPSSGGTGSSTTSVICDAGSVTGSLVGQHDDVGRVPHRPASQLTRGQRRHDSEGQRGPERHDQRLRTQRRHAAAREAAPRDHGEQSGEHPGECA